LLKAFLHAKEVEETNWLRELDKEVNVTVRPGVTACNRPEKVERAHAEAGELGSHVGKALRNLDRLGCMGFYSLSAFALQRDDLPKDLVQEAASRHSAIPAGLIGQRWPAIRSSAAPLTAFELWGFRATTVEVVASRFMTSTRMPPSVDRRPARKPVA